MHKKALFKGVFIQNLGYHGNGTSEKKMEGDAFSNKETQKLLQDLHSMMIKELVAMETKEVNVCNFKQPEKLMADLDLEIGDEPVNNDTVLKLCKSVIDHSIKTGGSFANMLAMHIARYKAEPSVKKVGLRAGKQFVLLTSAEAHYSIAKGANFLGFGTDNAIRVDTDDRGRMVPDDLDKKLQQAKDKGEVPLFVMGTTGTTVLGACDDLNAIADICQRHGVWFHVDAAWGGGVILSEKYKHLMDGVHRADSVAWNIHKMSTGLIQSSILLVKEKGLLEQANQFRAEYLFQPDKHYDTAFDIGDKTVQCGRKVDVLKLWTMWKARGDVGMAEQIDKAFENAQYLTDRLRSTEGFRLVIPEFQCTNISFWYIPPRLRGQPETTEWWEQISKVAPQIKKRMMENGSMMIGYNPLTPKGFVNFFRVIITNPMSTHADMDFILEEMERLGKDL
ncbi:hypothetical protein FSP39_019518 [Pinctada imbricata]|uniref:Cysteine sulfinic acid decarboxylase n=1 Tax=Pinctada imbricata TaxID=66713 RepID=A0AA89C988_PINIB|nr:hypothetical protein FSP39_019518 [Pinctada imbricata]